MEKKKTAMQKHIDGLKTLLSAAEYQTKDTEYWNGYISAITAAIRLAEANLSVEREQMREVWLDGDEKGWQTASEDNGSNHTIDSGAYSENFDEYFNNTYTQE